MERQASFAEEQSKGAAKLASSSTELSISDKLKHFARKLFAERSTSADDEAIKPNQKISVTELTDRKEHIRKKLAGCKAAQQECNFELAVSVLPPREMKPISVRAMVKMVANTIAVISACESKFALLGSNDEMESGHADEKKPASATVKNNGNGGALITRTGSLTEPSDEERAPKKSSTSIDQDLAELEMIKPKREIEFGDARLLKFLLKRIAKPYKGLQSVIARTVEVVTSCVAYTYVRSPHISVPSKKP